MMADQLEARINAIENIQEEFGHDIREMKRQLARLTQLVQDHSRIMAMYSKEHHLCQFNQPLTHSHIISVQVINPMPQLLTMLYRELIPPTCSLRGSFQMPL